MTTDSPVRQDAPRGRTELDERLESVELDPDLWVLYHLAHWSSRAESASFSGPVGSTVGPQPITAGNVIREQQPTMWSYIPTYGHIGIRMRASVDAGSMFAFWLSGIEDRPERSGEVCLAEIFGSSIRDGRADVGMGIDEFRDPALREAFTTVPMTLDTTIDHDDAVTWTPADVVPSVDGRQVHRVEQSPDDPVQLMIGVFDLPARREAGAPPATPELVVSRVHGRPLDD